MEQTETDLVSAADVPALFSQHHAALLRFARRWIGPELAEEEVAEAWFRLVRTLHEGAPIFREQAHDWLYRVLKNHIIDVQRRQRLVIVLPLLEHEADALDEHFEQRMGEREAIRRVLERLSPREVEALVLDAQGWKYREIASLVGTSESAVKMRVLRGRQAFVSAWEREAS